MTQFENEPVHAGLSDATSEPVEGVISVSLGGQAPTTPAAGHEAPAAAAGHGDASSESDIDDTVDQGGEADAPSHEGRASRVRRQAEDSRDDAEPAPGVAHDDDEVDDEDGDSPAPGQPGAKRAALENEGEIAADYLEELLDIADLDGDIDTFVEAGRAHVSIVTDSEVLVGKDGEVLDALQELARLAVMTETGRRSRLMLDIAGHRDKRRHELEALAQDAVTEVKDSGESVRLAPMNPFERKIVHDVVAAAGLVSESEGVEPQRRVVVLPA